MWTPIRKILPEKARALGLQKATAIYRLKKDWDNIIVTALGEKFQKKSKLTRLKDGALIVECLNSIWANELQLKKRLILARLTKEYKEVPIKQVKFIS